MAGSFPICANPSQRCLPAWRPRPHYLVHPPANRQAGGDHAFPAARGFHYFQRPVRSHASPVCCLRLITDAAAGNYQGLLALAFSRELPKGAMSEGMFLSVVCAEDMPRIQPGEIAAEAKGRFLGTVFFDTRMKPCEFWPKGVVGEDYYLPVVSDKPVLILSGANDPVTPPSWGDEVRALAEEFQAFDRAGSRARLDAAADAFRK